MRTVPAARAPGPSRGADSRERGVVRGHITIVQEDRIRVMDDRGRGYLFVVKKHAATLDDLERWRDERRRLRVHYAGLPDAGALAERIES